jgi:uncharacterized membrane protein YedE/YeeE
MLLALFGGALIGLSASLAHWSARQVVGVSGQLGSLLRWPVRPLGFGGFFIVGLIVGGALLALFGTADHAMNDVASLRAWVWLIVSGALVGYGTRLGNGCTSGHGVCGVSRLSTRSIVATLVFMLTAALVVFATRHLVTAWQVGP